MQTEDRARKRKAAKGKARTATGLRALPPPPSQPQQPRQRPMIPQPATPPEGYIEGRLDLNRYLIKHPTATFYVRVSGDSMQGAGINPGSILVVDRAVEAEDGDIVIARINDELCVKHLSLREGRTWLIPDNPKFQPIEIIESMDFEVWGRVMHAIRSY
jgi:DNA polymerase V